MKYRSTCLLMHPFISIKSYNSVYAYSLAIFLNKDLRNQLSGRKIDCYMRANVVILYTYSLSYYSFMRSEKKTDIIVRQINLSLSTSHNINRTSFIAFKKFSTRFGGREYQLYVNINYTANFSRKELYVRISCELSVMIIILPPVANLVIPGNLKANSVPTIYPTIMRNNGTRKRRYRKWQQSGKKRSSNYSIVT